MQDTDTKPLDLHTLCVALGFAVLIVKEDAIPKKEGAKWARDFAAHIEEFCVVDAAQQAINENEKNLNDDSARTVQRMIDQLFAILKDGREPTKQDLIALAMPQGLVNKHWAYALATAKSMLADG